MSIEQTHLILMTKGPEAVEFNLETDEFGKNKRNFGNYFTYLQFQLINVYFFVDDALFIYYVLYFGISMLGLLSNEIFYSLHLADVCQRFPVLQNVVKSVTNNSTQLGMTGLLLLIVMYIFTAISFFYLQDTDYDYNINPYDSDWIGEQRC
jgi:hypothetical protein